jgi:hypothetical protein
VKQRQSLFRDLFEDMPIWVIVAWGVCLAGSFVVTGAVIWLIFAVIDWLGSH